jgi:hypothetical protein
VTTFIPTPEEPAIVFSKIEFVDGAIKMTYTNFPMDLRGPLSAERSLLIPWGVDYDDELTRLIEAANDLLADALEDFDSYAPVDLSPRDDDDELPDE